MKGSGLVRENGGTRPAAIAGQFGIARSSVQRITAELKRRE